MSTASYSGAAWRGPAASALAFASAYAMLQLEFHEEDQEAALAFDQDALQLPSGLVTLTNAPAAAAALLLVWLACAASAAAAAAVLPPSAVELEEAPAREDVVVLVSLAACE